MREPESDASPAAPALPVIRHAPPRFLAPPIALTLLAFLGSAIVYGATAIATGRPAAQPCSYFDLLAAAFLDGKLYLEDPPKVHDLTPHEGRWYVPFPPLPED